jgi:signal peptidase II
MPRVVRLLAFVLLMTICIGCDRVTKHIASDELRGAEPVVVAGGLVRLEYAENPGAFLSLGDHMTPRARFWILGVGTASVLAAIAIVLARRREMRWSTFVSLCLILAGGASNLADRLIDGYVVDFAIMSVGPLHTGIFNMADVSIMAGVVLLTLRGLFKGSG